jgi:hypothetical protein
MLTQTLSIVFPSGVNKENKELEKGYVTHPNCDHKGYGGKSLTDKGPIF